ncbi:CHAD domain-containing protein [Mucilaginibacter xinganensis]|uniref:CHAD domain-containing protein n=1 Tax=Mucilaginibacter xinganensis TaxID=1234841 RepID=A0A223P2B6_9SPHI|nr:CHAD domain-containing protein [Mucilaginibacter xinganensis]ASU36299.1 hypothetical protein MuYL_4414 [Mucilaginibacter xinganensis]
MKSREERKYFDKEWKTMKAALTAFIENGEQENLHRFRVQVKKLRAFLILLDSLGVDIPLLKHFKPVRLVFKQAGEIRNAYINVKIGKDHQFNTGSFVAEQQLLMKNGTETFKSNGDKNLKAIKFAHKAIKGKIKPVSNLHINLFYQAQLKQIAASLAPLQFDESLHNARKRIKILIYNYKLVYKGLEAGFNEPYLDGVQKSIGDWHDTVLAIDLFSLYEVHNQTAFANLKNQLEKIKSNIIASTVDFYNQATTTVELAVEQLS